MSVLLSGAGGCTWLFYHPSRAVLGEPYVAHEDVRLRTSDGLLLHGWYFPAAAGQRKRGTLVQFHGNAGNLTSHFLSLAWVTLYGWDFLAFDYRGYGRSAGEPSASGLQRDALAAMRWAIANEAGRRPVFLYGQSLGGAVLADAFVELGEHEKSAVAGLVLEGTFHSYPEVAASITWRHPLLFPFTGVAYTCVSDAHDPAPALRHISPVPVLVVHGDRDQVVPPRFGQVVHDLARAPRELWIVPGAGHLNVLDEPSVRDRLLAWFQVQSTRWSRSTAVGGPHPEPGGTPPGRVPAARAPRESFRSPALRRDRRNADSQCSSAHESPKRSLLRR